eukprot:GHVL01020176.1.p3 GENE.GHVL01020176.1~~GHVL01020176.1.p3  ORF type:complete len:101 (-),score=10.35 GHVL01020176.1:143-445(-)
MVVSAEVGGAQLVLAVVRVLQQGVQLIGDALHADFVLHEVLPALAHRHHVAVAVSADSVVVDEQQNVMVAAIVVLEPPAVQSVHCVALPGAGLEAVPQLV